MEAGEVLCVELEFLFDCEGGADGACMAVQVVEKWKGVWQRATFWGVGRGGGGSEWGEGGEGVGGVRGEVRAARGAGVGDSGRGAGEGGVYPSALGTGEWEVRSRRERVEADFVWCDGGKEVSALYGGVDVVV